MVFTSTREYGWVGTVAKIGLRPFGVRHARFERLYDWWMDQRLNVSTRTFIEHEQLKGDPDSSVHATLYHGYPYGRLRFVFRAFIRTFRTGGPHRFVDIGCGEGRQVFYWAARGYRCVGLDFDSSLVERAVANRSRFRGDRDLVTFVLGDARTYTIDPEPSVISLFNPFDATILRSFMMNNRAMISNTHSVVLYMHDHHASVLSELGMQMAFRAPDLKISFWTVAP